MAEATSKDNVAAEEKEESEGEYISVPYLKKWVLFAYFSFVDVFGRVLGACQLFFVSFVVVLSAVEKGYEFISFLFVLHSNLCLC